MSQKSNMAILPWFTVENHETMRPWLGPTEMYELLKRGGFKIKQIFDLTGQILNLEVTAVAINHIRFEVELPFGWSLVEGFDGYGRSDRTLLHLVDAEDHLRGHVSLDLDNDLRPEKAEFYCRYTLNPYGGFYNGRLVEHSPDTIVDVIVDRAAVDPQKPQDFPIVVYHDSRPAKKGPLVLPPIDEFKKRLDEDVERVRAGRPQLDPPIYRWLHENYPQWRDPFAYW